MTGGPIERRQQGDASATKIGTYIINAVLQAGQTRAATSWTQTAYI